jgi:hypothetical protein
VQNIVKKENFYTWSLQSPNMFWIIDSNFLKFVFTKVISTSSVYFLGFTNEFILTDFLQVRLILHIFVKKHQEITRVKTLAVL